MRQQRELRLHGVILTIITATATTTAPITTATTTTAITTTAAKLDPLLEILNADLLNEVTIFHCFLLQGGLSPGFILAIARKLSSSP